MAVRGAEKDLTSGLSLSTSSLLCFVFPRAKRVMLMVWEQISGAKVSKTSCEVT